MAYRTFDRIEPLDLPIEAKRFHIDPDTHRIGQGIGNGAIAGLFGWLLIWAMGYVAWCLLP
jgi:hypothetical protein